MAESIYIPENISTKEEKYEILLPQIKGLTKNESDLIANLANICAVLKYGMNFFWVGFYLVEGDELVLGPFQGPVACTRIAKGKGVCGTSWEKAETIIVADVNKFPGHISCSEFSKSEIVVPVFNNDIVTMVLDVDSDKLNDFTTTDKVYLEKIVNLVAEKIT